MSFYSNVTEQNFIIVSKLAGEQKNQRAIELKNRTSKQTHDINLAESLPPINKNLEEVNQSTKQLGEVIKESTSNNKTPQLAIQNITSTQSLRDTLSFMKKSKNISKQDGKPNGGVFWSNILTKPLREKRIIIKDGEYNISPVIQEKFTNAKLTTKTMNHEDKSTVYDILKNTGFCSMRHNKGLKSTRMKDAFYNLPKAIAKIRNPPLPAIENVEDSYEELSDNLQGQGLKIIIPSKIIDVYNRLEILLRLRLIGLSDTLTESTNLIDDLYKRGEMQKEQQYRIALDKLYTQ